MNAIEVIIVLLALFGIKHFLADFVLQFPYMLQEKGVYGAEGGIHHSLVHSILTLVILFPFIGSAAAFGALFDGAVHYHIDWTKQQLNRGLTPADRMFWVWLGADQALHYLTYVAIIRWVVL
jgi:hypothetical protein